MSPLMGMFSNGGGEGLSEFGDTHPLISPPKGMGHINFQSLGVYM